MSSQKQIDANRANGALSRGPKTAAGKFRSSRNATRHGLFSTLVVLQNENQETFQALADEYIRRFCPVDEVEMGIVEEMIAAAWRIQRSYSIEKQQLDSGIEGLPSTSDARKISNSFNTQTSSPNAGILHQYQARLQRVKSHALRDLHLLRRLAKNANSEYKPKSHSTPCVSNEFPDPPAEGDPANPFVSDPEVPNEPNIE